MAREQSVNDVVWAIQKIARCDFRTGLYAYTTASRPEDVAWVGYAEHADQRRYFLMVDTGTPEPKIALLSKSESRKPIEEVNIGGNIEVALSIAECTKNGFSGVKRALGLDHLPRIVKDTTKAVV